MYFLGVDSGGTKTTALLVDTTRHDSPIRSLKLSAGNIAVIGKKATAELISNILSGLNLSDQPEQISWATFALAGAGRTEENKFATEIINSTGVRNFSLMTDAEILHYAIFGESNGVLLASGTGSICVFKDGENRYRQIGGWGYLLGDEGSGFDIGRKAIRAAISQGEVQKTSGLADALISFYDVKKHIDLITVVHASQNPQNKIAACAKLVCDLAEAGDPDALQIIESALASLLNLSKRAIEESHASEPVKMALSGSVLTPGSIVNRQFRDAAKQKGMPFEYLQQELHPAAAAVLFAMKMSGHAVSPDLRKRLKVVTFQ